MIDAGNDVTLAAAATRGYSTIPLLSGRVLLKLVPAVSIQRDPVNAAVLDTVVVKGGRVAYFEDKSSEIAEDVLAFLIDTLS